MVSTKPGEDFIQLLTPDGRRIENPDFDHDFDDPLQRHLTT